MTALGPGGAFATTARRLRDFMQFRIYRPAHLRIGLQDFFDLRAPAGAVQSNSIHLQRAMDWLCRAQDATSDGGVSARYRLSTGWAASYPETTGYIIPTFFNYAHLTQDKSYRQRAVRMADWLLTVQLVGGAFSAHDISAPREARVFNTGQALCGLLRAFRETGNDAYLNAASRAGDWLVSVQNENGTWNRFEYHQRPHAYHTEVDWPLLQLFKMTHKPVYRDAAVKNLDWVLSLQQPNGWFDQCGFKEDQAPYLHTIAYTVNGLLESGALLQPDQPLNNEYVQAARLASEALLHRFEIRHFMAGQFDRNWKATVSYSCLTGNMQTSINWLRLYEVAGDIRFLNGALKLNDFVKSTQDLHVNHPGIRGGIKGSHPLWGRYIRYSYPNWAAKFFVDALMLEDRLVAELYQREGVA
jgi:prenyltransferase beta subunit